MKDNNKNDPDYKIIRTDVSSSTQTIFRDQ